MRLHISVGITPDGDFSALYIGDDAEAAISAIQEAGKAGKIVKGIHLRNPHHINNKKVISFAENANEGDTVEPVHRTVEISEPEPDEKPPKKGGKKTSTKKKEVASPEKEEPSDADHFKKTD